MSPIFSPSDFYTNTSHFFNGISKMFCNFSLQFNITERRHVFFCALGVPETEEQIKLAKNKIHVTCSRLKGDSDAHI